MLKVYFNEIIKPEQVSVRDTIETLPQGVIWCFADGPDTGSGLLRFYGDDAKHIAGNWNHTNL